MAKDPTIEVTEGGVELPVVDVLTGRGAIFGKSGSGKSNTVGLIAEELLEQNFPLLIIDTDGEHYSLKEEYQLLHVGADGETCDRAVGPEHADALARIALDEGVPMILDVSDYIDRDEADELIQEVVHALFRLEKTREIPFPIFVEEAHEYIPEQKSTETAEILIKVGKRGRKRGLGMVAISQRPANVNKDFVTQADWRIWHTLTWRNDTKVVREVLGPEHANAVQDLDPGEALIDADWEAEVRSVQFKRKRTFDLGETPGLEDFDRPELQPINEDILSALTDITGEETEEERVEELETERERLEAEVADLREEVERLEGDEPSADSEMVAELREEKRELSSRVNRLESDYDEARETIEERNAQIEELREEVAALERLRDDVQEVRTHLRGATEVLGMADGDDAAAEHRDRIEELEETVRRLEDENERLREATPVEATVPTEYDEFYEHGIVEEAIDGAVERGSASERAIWAVILTIADLGGPVTYDDVRERGGYSDNTSVSKASTALETANVIEVVAENPKKLDFNFGAMEDIERKNKLRREMDDRIEQKVG